MTKLTRILGLILAVMMLAVPALTAAEEATVTDAAEMATATDVSAADVLAIVNGTPVERSYVTAMYSELEEEYGEYYDMTDPESIALFWMVAIDDSVYHVLMTQKEAELGLDAISDEDRAAALAEAQTYWQDMVEYYMQAYYSITDESTEEERLTAQTQVLAMLELYGYTEDVITQDYSAYILSSLPYERLQAWVVKDVAVDDEVIEAQYAGMVAQSKAEYEADPTVYVQNKEYYEYMLPTYGADLLSTYLGLSPSYYMPEGYRGMIQILLKPEDSLLTDYQAKQQSLQEQLTAKENGEATATDAASATDLVTQEDVDAAYAAVIASVQDKIDEIYAKLAEGVAFEELIAQYGEDPGMEDPTRLAEGYSVHLDSIYDPAFINATFSVYNVGDVSEPVLGTYGVHIVKYLRDVPAGEVPLTEELRSELAEELQDTLESQAFTAAINEWKEEGDIQYLGDGALMTAGTYTTAPAAEE